jgi:hypothetical protein
MNYNEQGSCLKSKLLCRELVSNHSFYDTARVEHYGHLMLYLLYIMLIIDFGTEGKMHKKAGINRTETGKQ